MPSYNIFFYSIILFLIGVLAASFGVGFGIIIVAATLLAAIFLLCGILRPKNLSEKISRSPSGQGVPTAFGTSEGEGKELFSRWGKRFWFSRASFLVDLHLFCLALLTVFILLGAGYYKYDDAKFRNIKIDFNKEINFSGIVIDDPQYSSNIQTLIIRLEESYLGRISVKLMLYPQFHYGDKISFKGKIEKPQGNSYASYLAKEKINGLSDFPKAELAQSGLGSKIKSALFNFKHSIIDSYRKVLPPDQAAFLAGLTFGERGGLTKEFKEAMSRSGTSHLTALSGLHLTIISAAVAILMGYLFSPALAFLFTALIIFGFVAMTGFAFSAARAAIMGFAVLLAKLVGRIYDPRNSIALAAFLIILFNPKALVFDLGFQLSFLAVLGIIYFQPAFRKLLKFKPGPGFLAWRENFLMTFSAQLATAPILIINFGNFSLTAFIANILILTVIPLTMVLGFSIGFFHFLSYYLALILGWLVSLFLNYEIFIINFFAKIAAPINPSLNFWGILAYYLILAGFVFYARNKA